MSICRSRIMFWWRWSYIWLLWHCFFYIHLYMHRYKRDNLSQHIYQLEQISINQAKTKLARAQKIAFCLVLYIYIDTTHLSSSKVKLVAQSQEISNCLLCLEGNESKATGATSGMFPDNPMFLDLTKVRKEGPKLICMYASPFYCQEKYVSINLSKRKPKVYT